MRLTSSWSRLNYSLSNIQRSGEAIIGQWPWLPRLYRNPSYERRHSSKSILSMQRPLYLRNVKIRKYWGDASLSPAFDAQDCRWYQWKPCMPAGSTRQHLFIGVFLFTPTKTHKCASSGTDMLLDVSSAWHELKGSVSTHIGHMELGTWDCRADFY